MPQESASVFSPAFQAVVGKYFQRDWIPADGIEPHELIELLDLSPAQKQLDEDVVIPLSLAEFYLSLGQADEVLETKHFFFDPDELEVRDSFLMFLEDESESFVWGIPLDQVSLPDPEVWRRDVGADEPDGAGEWSNEGGTVSELILDVLAWNLGDEEDNAAATAPPWKRHGNKKQGKGKKQGKRNRGPKR